MGLYVLQKWDIKMQFILSPTTLLLFRTFWKWRRGGGHKRQDLSNDFLKNLLLKLMTITAEYRPSVLNNGSIFTARASWSGNYLQYWYLSRSSFFETFLCFFFIVCVNHFVYIQKIKKYLIVFKINFKM